MTHKLISAVAALVTGLALMMSPVSTSPAAAADPGINTHFGTAAWWNYDIGALHTRYQYTNYPVPCNEEPSGAAWEIIWAYKEGTTPSIPTAARQAVIRATSIFAASAKQRVSTWAQVRNNSYTPRWETSGSGDGNCTPQFNAAAIPATVWPNDDNLNSAYNWMGPNGIGTYVRNTLGANEPNRKYLILRATEGSSHANNPGWSEPARDDDQPGPSNQNNATNLGLSGDVGIQ